MIFQQVFVLGARVTTVNKTDTYQKKKKKTFVFKELTSGGKGQKISKYTHKIPSVSEISKCNSGQ